MKHERDQISIYYLLLGFPFLGSEDMSFAQYLLPFLKTQRAQSVELSG